MGNKILIRNRLEKIFTDDRLLIFNFWIITLLIVALRKDDFHLHLYEIFHSFNLIGLIALINYYFFPKFYEKGSVSLFVLFVLIGVFLTGYFEELVIERHVFYNERAFPISSPVNVFVAQGLPVFIFMVLKLMIYFRDKQIEIDRLEREKSESQLQFLKSQIDPHILFNNLNNIYSLSEQNDPRTSETILKLSNLMRYVIYESSENHVLLTKEIEYLKDYLELQKIQIEGRGKVDFRIVGDPNGFTIAPLLLVPFIENCFKHSMHTQIKDISIGVKIEILEDRLIYKSANTFQQSASKDFSPKGIGLANTRKRLELLYPEKHKLEVCEDEHCYYVKLMIEII